VSSVALDPVDWADEQFGLCDFGDVRRMRRVVKVAAQIAANTDASTPSQTENWSDCKRVYELFDNDHITFQKLLEPHWRATRARKEGHFLLICDTTEFDFGIHRKTKGLGPTGDGNGRGFFLHSAMMVDPTNSDLIGMAAQEIFHRKPCRKGEKLMERKKRARESEVWGRIVDQVGPPAPGVRFTHVCDRGADNYEVFCHLVLQRSDWVIRAAQLQRSIIMPNGERMPLDQYVMGWQPVGSYDLYVQAQNGQPARWAKLEVSFGDILMPAPQQRTPWLKEIGIVTIAMWGIQVREVDAPAHVKEPLRWVLFTSHATYSYNDAYRVIEYYEQRPMVEDYHKAIKTGCSLEDRQYQTTARLERLTGMMSLQAVRLVQLRTMVRTQPETPATKVVSKRWIEILARLRKKTDPLEWTIRNFYREMAGLGGFLGRKGDGEPGWQTTWRGFNKLIQALRGYEPRRHPTQ